MTYLSPSMTFMVNRLGAHEFRGGADLYPNLSNKTGTTAAPVEFYYRPPGTTGSQDVLFERDILRGIDGSNTISNNAYEHAYARVFPGSLEAVREGLDQGRRPGREQPDLHR